jgi:protein-L-isoaspartate(D-aspartate) O-methyltransferase
MAAVILGIGIGDDGAASDGETDRGSRDGPENGNGSSGGAGISEEIFRHRREKMVETQIRARGITNPALLEALKKVPRHLFVPESLRGAAYEDAPTSIGEGQTISQPYIVAMMTGLIDPRPGDRVLEVGTGCGYQTAILAELVREVFTIEIVEPLARRAAGLLADLGYTNVRARIGDGHRGWPEEAPFDAIVVTAAPERIPESLESQLAPGGRLVIPVGGYDQSLILVTRTPGGLRRQNVAPVRFVPMTGADEKAR